MNHIFKVVWCISTQKWIVASELSTSCHKQRSCSVNKIISSALLVGCSLTFGWADTIYDGTLPLTDSSTVPGNLEHIVGNGDGLFIGGSDVDLVINDNANTQIKFVVGGYSSGQVIDNVSNNSIVLEQGDITGDIYAGLSNYQTINFDLCDGEITCQAIEQNEIIENDHLHTANNNTVTFLNNSKMKVQGTIYASNIMQQIYFDNIKTYGQNAEGENEFSYIKPLVLDNGNSTFESSKNLIQIDGNEHVTQNVIVGNVSNVIKTGDVITADIENYVATVQQPTRPVQGNLLSGIELSVLSQNNNFSVNENVLNIQGE